MIDATADFIAPSFIAHNSELQQNADTPLSFHHSNNNNPTTKDMHDPNLPDQ